MSKVVLLINVRMSMCIAVSKFTYFIAYAQDLG